MKKSLAALLLTGAVASTMAAYAQQTDAEMYQEAMDNYENAKGETVAEFQSAKFPYIDRREVLISQGNGQLDLHELAYLQHQDRLALHFKNDTNGAVEVTIPGLESSFLVKAGEDRVYEFNTSAVGYHRFVDYQVESLVGAETGGIAENAELMRIINMRIVIPTFEDDEPVRRATAPAAGSNTVRGYW